MDVNCHQLYYPLSADAIMRLWGIAADYYDTINAASIWCLLLAFAEQPRQWCRSSSHHKAKRRSEEMKLTRMTPVHASPASDGARRLFAALTAAVCAIAPLALAVPQVASADSVSAVTGELCTPTTLELGDTTATSTTDTGVATYAGGNMYIGDPTSDWTTASPTGSYAAEAEGLTLVRKNFFANPLKGFFTFGTGVRTKSWTFWRPDWSSHVFDGGSAQGR
jgi:hypothetical protein